MSVAIIYCHPHDQSHNHKILDRVTKTLDAHNVSYDLIDLYKDNFDAYLKPIEYERASITKERVTEPDVEAMQKRLGDADTWVFIYPTWWYCVPARLKGFLDRVITPGFSYRFKKVPKPLMWGASIMSFIPGVRYLFQPYAVNGQLKGKKAYIFRTYGGYPLGRRMFGNTTKVLENVVLRFVGITNITIRELYTIDTSDYSEEKEQRFLSEVESVVSRIS